VVSIDTHADYVTWYSGSDWLDRVRAVAEEAGVPLVIE
jgi:hypothetical protein